MRKTAYIVYMAVLLSGPVLFGARRYYADMLVTLGALAGSMLLVAADAMKRRQGGRFFCWPETRFNWLWVGITALLLFQLAPMPQAFVRVLSPEAWVSGQKAVPAVAAAADPAAVPEFISFSVYRHPTQMALARFTAYALFFIGMLRLLDTRKRLERTVLVIVVLCLAEVLYGLAATYGGGTYILWEKWPKVRHSMSGTYVNRNHFAGLLEIGLMLAAGYAAALIRKKGSNSGKKKGFSRRLVEFAKDSEHRSKRFFMVFAGAMIVLGLALSSSRGGIVSATAGLLTLSTLLLLRTDHRWKGKVLLVIFAMGAVYALQAGIVRTVERFERTPESLEVRLRLAQKTFEIFTDYPAVGAGLGSFQHVYPRYQAAEDGKAYVDHAHSDWVEFLAEAGAVGMLYVLAATGWFVAGFFKQWKRRRDPLAVCLGAALPAILVSYGVHAVGEFNFHIPANFLMLMAAAAVCTAALLHEKRGRRERFQLSLRRLPLKGPGAAALVAVLVLCTGAALQAAAHFRAEAALAHTGLFFSHYGPGKRAAAHSSDPALAQAAARTAADRDPGNSRYPFYLAEARMQLRQQLVEKANGGHPVRNRAADMEIIRSLEKSISLNPYNASAHLLLGWEYARRFQNPDYADIWLPAADLSMDRAAYFAGEKTPRLHVDLAHYWTMRSATAGSPAWTRAVWHYRKALTLEPSARERKRFAAEIRSHVAAFYPEDVDRRLAEVAP